MSKLKSYRSCFVPLCTNTTKATPDKVFLNVPQDEKRRNKWFQAALRYNPKTKSNFFCCEDHFDLKDDMANYMYYTTMGGIAKTKIDVVPHKFDCRKRYDRKRHNTPSVLRPAAENQSNQEILSEENIEIDNAQGPNIDAVPTSSIENLNVGPSTPDQKISVKTQTDISNQPGAMVKKEERPHEAEVQALAEQFKEANKAKLPAPNALAGRNTSTLTLTTASGQATQSIGQRNNIQAATVAAAGNTTNDDDSIDDDSQHGRFGWTDVNNIPIPYIFRKPKEKYVSVRIVEEKLIGKYLNYLHGNVFHFTVIQSYNTTEAECRLFNEINIKHCDCFYGREQFTTNDSIVRLTDAVEFYNFLNLCYNKLQYNTETETERCGFIKINNESVVPYTVKDSVKYVPLFYFEGETDSLKLKAETLEGWDLAYLKFCCKVQGIRNELFASETCSVISLDDIISYFPSGTQFDDYWPPKVADGQLISKNPGTNTSWTKQPVGAVPGATPATSKLTSAHGRGYPPITPPTAGTPGASAALPSALWNNMLELHQGVLQQGIARLATASATGTKQQRTWQTGANS